MKIFIAIVYSLCLLQVAVAEQVVGNNTNATNVVINGQKIESSQDVKEIKLDQTTTAKVEILSATKKNDVGLAKEKDNNSNKNDKNILTKEIKENTTLSASEDKKIKADADKKDNDKSIANNIFTKLLNTDDKKKDNIKSENELKMIQKNVDNDEIKNGAVLTIKDGDKNININFSPNIVVECEKCKKNTKNAKNKSVNNAKTKVGKKKTSNLKKTRKTIQAIKTQSITTNNNQNIATNNDIIKQASETQYAQFTNSHKTIRGLYEKKNSQIDGVVENNDNPEYVALQQAKNNDDNQPIEVITKIIMVDENANITQNLIEELNRDNNNIQVVEPNKKNGNFNATANSFQLAYASASNSNFIQNYDIIREDKLKYGEVAFIDDYNE